MDIDKSPPRVNSDNTDVYTSPSSHHGLRTEDELEMSAPDMKVLSNQACDMDVDDFSKRNTDEQNEEEEIETGERGEGKCHGNQNEIDNVINQSQVKVKHAPDTVKEIDKNHLKDKCDEDFTVPFLETADEQVLTLDQINSSSLTTHSNQSYVSSHDTNENEALDAVSLESQDANVIGLVSSESIGNNSDIGSSDAESKISISSCNIGEQDVTITKQTDGIEDSAEEALVKVAKAIEALSDATQDRTNIAEENYVQESPVVSKNCHEIDDSVDNENSRQAKTVLSDIQGCPETPDVKEISKNISPNSIPTSVQQNNKADENTVHEARNEIVSREPESTVQLNNIYSKAYSDTETLASLDNPFSTQDDPVQFANSSESLTKNDCTSLVKDISETRKDGEGCGVTYQKMNANVAELNDHNELLDNYNVQLVSNSQEKDEMNPCFICEKVKECKYKFEYFSDIKYLCDSDCLNSYSKNQKNSLKKHDDQTCIFCNLIITSDVVGKIQLSFGNTLYDFCTSVCMQNWKLQNKLCGHCKLPTTNGPPCLSAPHDMNGENVNFCNQDCLDSYKKSLMKCANCQNVMGSSSLLHWAGLDHNICSQSCFEEFTKANKIDVTRCSNCQKMCVGELDLGTSMTFCSSVCLNSYKVSNPVLVACTWCGVKKKQNDMIKKMVEGSEEQPFCTLHCLSLFRVDKQASSIKMIQCDFCKKTANAQYHLTMSDASLRNFCSYPCVVNFQKQFSFSDGHVQNVSNQKLCNPLFNQEETKVASRSKETTVNCDIPVIGSVMSLSHLTQDLINASSATKSLSIQASPNGNKISSLQSAKPYAKFICPPKQVKNKALQCKPITQSKSVVCSPVLSDSETQTDESLFQKPVLIPVPVPVYIPVPMRMYTQPVPYPMPIPLPIPVPCFIPTTKKSAKGILQQIKDIQEKIPDDPFEAELLMMAEAVATDKNSSGESSDEEAEADPLGGFHETITNSFGEDLLQTAMRVAESISEPAMDLESSVKPMTVNPATIEPTVPVTQFSGLDASHDIQIPQAKRSRSTRGRAKRNNSKKSQNTTDDHDFVPQFDGRVISSLAKTPQLQTIIPSVPADHDKLLKFTYGVNAWKHWVNGKTIENRSKGLRNVRSHYKAELLQCTADQLNVFLCQFVRELRKPNGDKYAPDSIYYLCLGIQQYLYENGRIDNIFSDVYFERFTEALDEILQEYEVKLNTQGLIVCRIQEEHLWESKQLGAHSPHVLLNTLIYFNTKHFLLRTAGDHISLSFSHIMKHWKRTQNPNSKSGRMVYLRYYTPGSGPNEPGSKRKREDIPVYEQVENSENPLRCPVKLYEFYLSKCPESIKNRNDVFYLTPERSCVPDSPVWYSTMPLNERPLQKMLSRLQVVREIQEVQLQFSTPIAM